MVPRSIHFRSAIAKSAEEMWLRVELRRVESAGSMWANDEVRPPDARVVDMSFGVPGRRVGRGLIGNGVSACICWS
jgi:hypothetical protein